MDYVMTVASIPGAKGFLWGVVYGGIRSKSFNPMKALKKIGWVDYLSGYASGFIAGYLIFGIDH